MGSGLSDIALTIGQAAKGADAEVANIIEFCESRWGVNLHLFPVQRVILKAHYGIELDAKTTFKVAKDWTLNEYWHFNEKQYLEYLFNEGRSNIKAVDHDRPELVLVIGRRSGKTYLAAAVGAYETYKLLLKGDPQGYYGIPPGKEIGIISVATDKDQAGILYRDVSAYFSACGFFSPYTANNTQTYARFQTPEDINHSGRYCDNPGGRASLRVSFRSCIAKGLRGPGNMIIILDELAHFTDGTQQSSAQAVYDAITPSTATFSQKDPGDSTVPIGVVEGRILSISSPLGRQGMFYKLYEMAMAGGRASQDMLAIQAPSWEVNPTIPASYFESKYVKDPTVFFTEFGGVFSDRTRGWIEREDDLLACVDPGHRPMTQAPAKRPHFVGIDLGLVGDGTAIAIGHIELLGGESKIVLDVVDQIKAGEGDYEDVDRLDFDEVARWVHSYSRRFYMSEGLFDQWSGIAFEQALAKKGLAQLKSQHFTKNLTSEIFRNFKDMMWDKRLVLYDWPLPQNTTVSHCDYIQELLELQAQYHTKYVTTVAAPNVDGKHDDRSDAIVRMVWLASQNLGNARLIMGVQGGRAAAMQGARNGNASLRKARLKARQTGTSPDRQPSPHFKNRIRGRR